MFECRRSVFLKVRYLSCRQKAQRQLIDIYVIDFYYNDIFWEDLKMLGSNTEKKEIKKIGSDKAATEKRHHWKAVGSHTWP